MDGSVKRPLAAAGLENTHSGLDPAAWLKDTLIKLPAWPNSRIDELLPFTSEFIKSLKRDE